MKRKTANLLTVLILTISITMIAYSITRVNAEGTPTVQTDKADYAPSEVVIVTGSGFDAGRSYAVPVIRPNGTIVIGDGSFTPGWDNITADENGAFTYNYKLDGILGNYTVRVYSSLWTGNLEEIPIAAITFTDAAKFRVGIVSVTPSSVTVTQGTNATYSVTVYRNDTGAFDATLSLTNSGPSIPGANIQFYPNPVSLLGGDDSKSSQLNITTGSLSPNTYTFKVLANNTNNAPNDYNYSGTVTLIVQAATYSVTFTESGLPSGTSWSATFGASTYTSTTTTITITGVSAGIYLWNVSTPISGATGIQYIASPSSGTMNVSTQTSQSITYTTQYRLTMATNFGTTSPGVGGGHWYDAGSVVTISATAPVPGAGERYVWNGWTGAGSDGNTTMFNPAQVTMNSAVNETASWTHQFQITFAQSGLSSDASGTVVTVFGSDVKTLSELPNSTWVDSDSSVSFSYEATVGSTVSGKQYVLTGVSGNTTASSVTVNSAVTVTGSYKTQWFVTFAQSGVDSDFSGDAMKVDGTNYTRTGYSDWYDNDSSVVFSFYSPLTVNSGKRYFFVSVNETSALTVLASETVTGSYKTQWFITFAQSGLDGSASGTVVTVNGTTRNYSDLPFSEWVNDSDTIVYTFQGIVSSSTVNMQFKLKDVSGPLTGFAVTESETVMGNYVVQWNVTFVQTGLDNTASSTIVTINGTAKTFGQLPNSTWVDSGDKIEYSYESIVSSSTADKQFRLDSVTGTASPITVTSSVTVMGNYIVQWNVTFHQTGLDNTASGTVANINASTKVYGDLPNSTWVDDGDKIVYSYEGIVASATPDKQFRLKDVIGLASPITVTGSVSVTGNYVVQWYVTITQTGLDGSAITDVVTINGTGKTYGLLPNETWVDSGDTIEYEYAGIVTSSTADKQFRHNSVTGPTSPIMVTGPVTVVGNYVVQWNVTITQTGLDISASSTVVTVNGSAKTYGDLPNMTWVDNGNGIEYSFESIVASSTAGKQFRLDSVTGSASPMTVTGPVTVTGNYVVQWNVTFTQSGVDTDFSGTVITVNLTDYTRAGYSAWTDDGSIYNFDFKSPMAVSAGKQYVLVNVNASSGFTVSAATTVTGTYKTQYWIVFNQDGVDTDFSGTVMTVNGTGYDRDGYSAWTDSGDVYTFAYSTPLLVAANEKQYVLTGVNETTGFTVSGFETVTGTYNTQFWIVFAQAGVGSDFALTVMEINGTNFDRLGSSFWAFDGDYYNFSFISPLVVNGSKQYVWASTSGLSSAQSDTSFKVTQWGSITGNYGAIVLTYTGDTSGQYSDPVTVTATLMNGTTGISGKTITFIIGTQSATAITNSSGIASTSIVLNQTAGTYMVNATCAGASGTTLFNQKTFIIDRENVAITYTGDTLVFTASTTTSTATVHLAAHLVQEADGYPGDLTLANVTFALFKSSNLGATPDLTFNAAVNASGDALTTAILSADVWTVRVTIQAGNLYWTQSSEGLGILVVSLPGLSATGGGWIPCADSANGKVNFGFTVSYQKNAAPKGNFVCVFRGKDGYDYVVKSNSWQGGGLSFTGTNKAYFTGKCNVQQINRTTGQVVASWGNYRFAVDITDGDSGSPQNTRTTDTIAITIFDSTMATWRQIGTSTAQIPLGGGNIVVHSK